MKKSLLLVALLLTASLTLADETENEWTASSLTEETMQKIQQAQLSYKKCVADAMQKPEFAQLESRRATDAIARQCEATLGQMRQVYLDSKVPMVIADRHLKKLRIDVTRKMLYELMYLEAARAAAKP